MNRIIKILQTVLSVGAIGYILYLFAFFMDGEMGAILIAFMLTAPLVSFGFAVYARNRVMVSFDCDSFVKKGSELTIRVKLEKNGFFPLSIVELHPSATEVFEKTDKVYRLSLNSERKTEFEFKIKAKVGGNGCVSIDSAYSCGFLGFIKLKIKTALPEAFSVGVIPDVPEIKGSSLLFRSIADVVMTSDEEDDDETAMLFSANTVPGYEHREYVQGDPIKRVNWKLSSKKNKMMVRLDEASSSVQPLIVLDLYRKKDADAEYAIITEEKLLRSVFGLLILLVKQGISCNFAYYGSSGELIVESADNPDAAEQLLLKVLSVKVTKGRRIDFSGIGSAVCACLAATTDAGAEFAEIIHKINDTDHVSILGISAESSNAADLPFWYLDDDNNFKLV